LDNFSRLLARLISIGDLGGELVALQWVAHGSNTGPFPDGTPATGHKVTFPGVSFVQLEGGKIRLEKTYFDRLGEHKQLGFIKD
jgi:predicted ester cyclase